MAERRYGMTVPLDGVGLHEQAAWAERLAMLGYTDLWSSEGMGADAFTPLAVASVAAPSLHLGTAIVPVFTRGPACIAQSAATLAATAPGRFSLGLGASSDVIVERWNDVPFDKPYQRTRDLVLFLRSALAGNRVDEEYETFAVRGFRLAPDLVSETPPPILVAALRAGMLRLAGREADGAIINWLSADDVKTVVPYVHEGGPGKQIVARIMVFVTEDADKARSAARRMISTYLNVPVYKAFHEWLGRTDQLSNMWDAWAAGDRKAATGAVPDDTVDQLIVHGSPDQCREHIGRYVANGVTTPIISLVGSDLPIAEAIGALAPRG